MWIKKKRLAHLKKQRNRLQVMLFVSELVSQVKLSSFNVYLRIRFMFDIILRNVECKNYFSPQINARPLSVTILWQITEL